MPPEKSKPTESEKAAVTLGALGEKLGTRKCKACGLYATHNARTCLTLEHNRIRLEAMRNKERGRPPGTRNKKEGWKQVCNLDEEESRVKTWQKVVAINSNSEDRYYIENNINSIDDGDYVDDENIDEQ